MNALVLLSVIMGYFGLLLGIAFYTSRKSDNQSFFNGNKSSKWWVVAFGMVGTSLSGITFISVPGTVAKSGFEYFQVVLGYIIGYFAVSFILLPLYYRLNLTSIYTYLKGRFGTIPYKTGALLFIVSRTLGATLRLYVVIKVLQLFILQPLHIPFEVTTILILLLILLYTYRGGVKTIVWTDTLQTTFMLLALIVCIVYVMQTMHLSAGEVRQAFSVHHFDHLFVTDFMSPAFCIKQILGGAFITITMTGLDQEMMQKNISVRKLADSQKNMLTMSFLQAFVVFVFLSLGGLLYLFAISKGGQFAQIIKDGKPVMQFLLDGKAIPGDNIFPIVVFGYLPPVIGLVFVIGLISALFPSADGALTALTSSFCIDVLGIFENKKRYNSEIAIRRTRLTVHYCFAALFLVCVFVFRQVDNGSIIQLLLDVAGYTYGPLLALFAFGIFTKRKLVAWAVPIICIAGPVLSYLIRQNDAVLLHGYRIGLELLVLNGLITFLLLYLFSKTGKKILSHPD